MHPALLQTGRSQAEISALFKTHHLHGEKHSELRGPICMTWLSGFFISLESGDLFTTRLIKVGAEESYIQDLRMQENDEGFGIVESTSG